jgi:histidyl-tRNA synthetase
MLRGTRILDFDESKNFVNMVSTIRNAMEENRIDEMIFPSIWETSTFTDKLGREKEQQMWTFQDKKGRECCLVPEVTGIVQQMWRESWKTSTRNTLSLFYIQRCYRYERPQSGRYREFTQFGFEMLGPDPASYVQTSKRLLRQCMERTGVEFEFVDSVKRGLSYYTGDGFEVECPVLGAQKQVAGGGAYPEGAGFAIGIDRLVLAAVNSR